MSSPSDASAEGDAPTTGFRVGKGIGIATESTLVLLEPVNGTLAERLWNLVSSGAGVDELLEELSSTGLRTLGSFAMAQFEGAITRVVVRGTAKAEVVADGATRQVGAPGVRTWVEELIEGVSSISLRLVDPAPDLLPFRVSHGLLPADALYRGVSQTVSLTGLDTDWVDDFRSADALLDPPVVSASEKQSVVAESDVDPSRTIAPSEFRERGLPKPVADEPAPEVEYDYDAIYGRTVTRSVQSAAVHQPDEGFAEHEPIVGGVPPNWGVPSVAPTPDASPPTPMIATPVIATPMIATPMIDGVPSSPAIAPQLGDHDGLTMTKAQIQALRASMAGAPVGAAPAGMGGPTVQAVLCAGHHPNPPHESICRVCHGPLSSAPVVIARPVLATLRFSTGTAVALDRPALIGRNPKVEGTMTSEIPNLIKLDVGQGLSRTHASIKLAGWQVLLEDLNSANGTIVTLPGRAPRRLHSGEPVLLEIGTLVDFGGEISCVVEAV